MPITAGFLSRAVETAQKKVEGQHFSIRKRVLQYDDVMNLQREIIYKQRREVLDGKDLKDNIHNMIEYAISYVISKHAGEEINKEALLVEAKNILNINKIDSIDTGDIGKIQEELEEKVFELYASKEKEFTPEHLREIERVVLLKVVDQKWMNHIDAMDELKNGIGLRAYGQKNPVDQYRIEGSDMFEEMVSDIKLDVAKLLLHIEKVENVERKSNVKITSEGLQSNSDEPKTVKPNTTVNHTPIKNDGPQVGRNDPCPCGSGKKYKNCCGRQ